MSSLAGAGEGRTNGAEDGVLRSKNRECVHPLDPAVRRPPPGPIAPEAAAGRPNPRRADQSKILLRWRRPIRQAITPKEGVERTSAGVR
jgi:hypothetical protein